MIECSFQFHICFLFQIFEYQILNMVSISYTKSSKAVDLVHILHQRAIEQPADAVCIFLQDGEAETGRLTYGDLHQQACRIADYLRSHHHISPGQRALLLYPSGLEFVTAFFGCLYADIIAVPAYPPRRNQKLERLLSIARDAQTDIALTTANLVANIQSQWSQDRDLFQLRWIATDHLPENISSDPPSDWQQPVGTRTDQLAFLQYTSGSTGDPKGIMVTHGHLMANQKVIAIGAGNNESSIYVTWLPLFHDLGLIGNLLQSVYLGISCILMPPTAFLYNPMRWLQAISRYRATASGGPNFAYDLCVKKIKPAQLEDLDLSCWQLAFNAAEPVRAETLERFAKTFAPCGFQPKAFYPCYGIAENTLFVTGVNHQQAPQIVTLDATALQQNQALPASDTSTAVQTFVSCGYPRLDETVSIVNPESLTLCPEDSVGEIWLSGASMTNGYWNQPEKTDQVFRAYLSDSQSGPFLRTGDLGFILEGELFITGRIKDILIIRGRNYYPQDIELTAQEAHPALQTSSAAFCIDVNHQPSLVVLQEVKRSEIRKLDAKAVVEAITRDVLVHHGLQVYAAVLLKPGGILRTSSGKVQRYRCRQHFLDNTLRTIDSWHDIPQYKSKFANLWSGTCR